MGEIADQIIEQFFNFEGYDDYYNEEPTWTTKEGKKVPVKKMKTSHIHNAYFMLCRKGKGDHYIASVMREELTKRGAFSEHDVADLA